MEKKPLSEEQVKELVEFINSGKWVDFAEVVRYKGFEKLTHIEITLNKLGLVTAAFKDLDPFEFKDLQPVYHHSLYKTDYAIVGEEEKGRPIKWILKSDKYTLPEDKKLARSLIDALETHKESCDFNDSFKAFDRMTYAAIELTEAQIRKEIKKALPTKKRYAFFDSYGECQELYCYENLKELFLLLMLDMDECGSYRCVTKDQAVDILFHRLTESSYYLY